MTEIGLENWRQCSKNGWKILSEQACHRTKIVENYNNNEMCIMFVKYSRKDELTDIAFSIQIEVDKHISKQETKNE